MSEKNQPDNPEFRAPNIENEVNHESEVESHSFEKHEATPERSIEELSSKVDAEAISGAEYSHEDNAEVKQHPALVNKQLKDMAYSRSLIRTRKHLSYPAKLLSKIVHSKVIDRPSEAIGKTLARPSIMLGGAIFAFIGTSLVLWVTKKYGYEYNYLAVIVIFVIGMIMGLLTEGIVRVVKKRQ